jgi:endo-1,4-beta-xylanase
LLCRLKTTATVCWNLFAIKITQVKKILNYVFSAVVISIAVTSCKKNVDDVVVNPVVPNTDTVGPLKSAVSFPVGFAIENNLYMNNAVYRATVNREVNSVTFGNEMKQGSILQSNGTYNFTTADALFTAVNSAGIAVHGHVLGWHQQQSTSYIKTFAGITTTTAAELAINGDMEAGVSGWILWNPGGSTMTATNVAAEVHGGTGALKLVNPTAHAGQQYAVQVSSNLINTTVGKDYLLTYWVKGLTAGGIIRLSTQDAANGNASYQSDQTIGTTYSQITWTFTAKSAQTRLFFDMGNNANTYFVDDVSFKEVTTAPVTTQLTAKVDLVLKDWITTIVTRYAGKIKAWDVINEMFTESGAIRNNANTLNSSSTADVFVWSEYLGRDFGYNAFKYAKAADPAALLFINDYNLESSNAKLDSLIAYVKEIQARGAKVDGIGSQMHITINTPYSSIDNMFKKLAATGLSVRISELDVRINPAEVVGFVPASTALTSQANMYNYVANSFLRNVPAAQRYGLTVWGVDDPTSWLYKNGIDYPLLYDKNFDKKPAYKALLLGLKGK